MRASFVAWARHSLHIQQVTRRANLGRYISDTAKSCDVSTVPALAALQDCPLLSAHSVVVTRGVEWLTIAAAVEQANLYGITNGAGQRLGLIAERGGGAHGVVLRQLLRNHRRFSADVFNAAGGHPLAHITRPAYLLAGQATVRLPDGTALGEVRRVWHPYRRLYRLYLGKQQFAAVQEGLLAWDFRLRDAQGGTLGLVDRHFRGPALEWFADAGRYALHFGCGLPEHATPSACLPGQEAGWQTQLPRLSEMAKLRTGAKVIATKDGDLLEVARPLSAAERLVALAAAVCIDFDYFSGHSWEEGQVTGDYISLDGMGGLPSGGQAAGADADGQDGLRLRHTMERQGGRDAGGGPEAGAQHTGLTHGANGGGAGAAGGTGRSGGVRSVGPQAAVQREGSTSAQGGTTVGKAGVVGPGGGIAGGAGAATGLVQSGSGATGKSAAGGGSGGSGSNARGVVEHGSSGAAGTIGVIGGISSLGADNSGSDVHLHDD